jgi:DNA-binding response OmpR family regulator
MSTRVLVIDADEAFATLLKEGLEADREYLVTTVPDGTSALAALQSNAFDLIILDLGLTAPEPAVMLRAIRGILADLPIMVIPLDGDLVPPDIAAFDVKGVLTKPFFLPDLPARVAEALGRPAPAPPPAAPPAASDAKPPARTLPRLTLRKDDPRLIDLLRALAEMLNAESALLSEGNALVAHAGPLSRSGAETIARRVLSSRASSAHASWVTSGNEQVRFGQSISDTGEHLLYSLDVAEGVVLTVAVRPDSSLRAIRAQVRQTAEALLALGS